MTTPEEATRAPEDVIRDALIYRSDLHAHVAIPALDALVADRDRLAAELAEAHEQIAHPPGDVQDRRAHYAAGFQAGESVSEAVIAERDALARERNEADSRAEARWQEHCEREEQRADALAREVHDLRGAIHRHAEAIDGYDGSLYEHGDCLVCDELSSEGQTEGAPAPIECDGSPYCGAKVHAEGCRASSEGQTPPAERAPANTAGAGEPEYVVSDGRLAEIRSYLAETQDGWQIPPAPGVSNYMLAGAVFDLLAERDAAAASSEGQTPPAASVGFGIDNPPRGLRRGRFACQVI